MLATVLLAFAFVLFVLSAALWQALVEPHRVRLIAAGLACWIAAQLFGPMWR